MAPPPLAEKSVSSVRDGATQSPPTISVRRDARSADEGLENPRWGKTEYRHGAEVEMLVDGPGLDGRTVRFEVERSEGNGRWVKVAEATAKVERGTAVGFAKIQHPAIEARRGLHIPAGVDAGARTLRFNAELAD